MSGIEKPCLAASVLTGPRIECPLNVDVSMPPSCVISLNHLATVAEETGLCGVM